MKDDILDRLILRLEKINIKIELCGNYPWIYLEKVNNNKIKKEDYYLGDWGFTIAFLPIRLNEKMELTNIKKVFEIIRKYK